jgi:hypothetical protein
MPLPLLLPLLVVVLVVLVVLLAALFNRECDVCDDGAAIF